MAVINLTVEPILDPSGRSVIVQYDNGLREAFAKITIPAGTTYSTTDRCLLVHSDTNTDFSRAYGGAKNVVFLMPSNDVATAALATGKLGMSLLSNQRVQLRTRGNNGTSIVNDNEVNNGTAFAAACNGEARILYRERN